MFTESAVIGGLSRQYDGFQNGAVRRVSKRLSSPMMSPVTLVMPAALTAWAS